MIYIHTASYHCPMRLGIDYKEERQAQIVEPGFLRKLLENQSIATN
ncbi:hypothetical protein [Lyngbya sp. PCC 8106]|nr:hypothetical protein [Lyngbya sp. PCC 8106]